VAGSGSGCASAVADDNAPRVWREHLKVHPAADLFPLMSEAELRELGEDIKANGLLSPIALYKGELVDGRNRLDAMELVGLTLNWGVDIKRLHPVVQEIKADPYTYVMAANLHRRHLTDEQRRELIAKVIKAKPEASDRTIAKQVKRDHKTVAKIRKELESTGEVSPVETRVGADGKARKQTKARPKPKSKPPQPPPITRATGSDEIDVEQHRAKMARLDQPTEETVTDFDRRVGFVIGTALTQVAGLSVSETGRFFAALRDRLDDAEREVLRDADDRVMS